jgi:Tfp pilus assembly protein PilZ
VRLSVVLSHPRAGWSREAQLNDLGLGGACVRLTEPIVVGEKILVAFIAPSLWDPLSIAGRVAWAGPATRHELARAGVAFEPSDGAAILALYEFMGTLRYDG